MSSSVDQRMSESAHLRCAACMRGLVTRHGVELARHCELVAWQEASAVGGIHWIEALRELWVLADDSLCAAPIQGCAIHPHLPATQQRDILPKDILGVWSPLRSLGCYLCSCTSSMQGEIDSAGRGGIGQGKVESCTIGEMRWPQGTHLPRAWVCTLNAKALTGSQPA